MVTLGIDLSAQPAKTACCRILWRDGGGELMSLGLGWSDERLLELSTDVDAIGIDAPFGFPALINRALPEYAGTGRFPQRPADESEESWSQRLRFRETDRAVHRHVLAATGQKLWPLSVSSNLIAVCAWRCAALLSRLFELFDDPVDRVGDRARTRRPLVIEVYPSAALAAWSLRFKGYKPGRAGSAKSARASETREAIVTRVLDELGERFTISPEHRSDLLADDDLLDAFVASLVTRAAALGHTVLPSAQQRPRAEEEGWIHLPDRPLRDLIAAG